MNNMKDNEEEFQKLGINNSMTDVEKAQVSMKDKQNSPPNILGNHRPKTKEHRLNISKGLKGKYVGKNNHMWRGGLTLDTEHKKKITRDSHRNSYEKKKLVVFSHYSQGNIQCNCCGEKIYKFLTLDHINNDGKEHRKNENIKGSRLYYWIIKNNFPAILQLLCFNCNFGKNVNKGVCPHQNIQKKN